MLKPRTYFAQHKILRLLATGNVAELHEVIGADGVRKALKILQEEDASLTSKLQERLAQEAEAISMIDHVNVVRLHRAGVEDGRVYLLLELVEGPDLRTLVREAGGALPVERAVRLVRQACEGVAAGHALGILHRDLKPENLLVAPGELLKVADFGSAKLLGWGVKTTREGPGLCSFANISPERIANHPAEPRSDVYALALILYEIIAGMHPIALPSMLATEVLRRHVSFDPPPLDAVARDVPGDLSALVRRGMSKRPEDRPWAREMADGLAVVSHWLRAPHRAAARNLLLPGRELGLAKTEPAMPAHAGGGPLVMPAVTPAGREALLPPPAPQIFGGTVHLPAPLPAIETADRRSTGIPVERAAPRSAGGPLVGGVGALLVLGLAAAGWLLLGGAPPTATPPSPAGSAATPPADGGGTPVTDAGSPATTATARPPATSASAAAPTRRRAPPPRPKP